MLAGFKERFENDLKVLAQGTLRTDMNVVADLHRKYASWIGGPMIGSLSTFDDMCIKQSEYEEQTTDKETTVLQKTIF